MGLLSLLPFLTTLIGKLIPDKAAAEKAKRELERLDQKGELDLLFKQIQTNIVEAGHPSIFVAGWRPAIGWTCAIAFAYHFVAMPFLVFIAAATGHIIPLPAFDMSTLIYVLGGLLGLGSLRTYEKAKGISK